jgi:uncharacterized protein (TIGR03435 family)
MRLLTRIGFVIALLVSSAVMFAQTFEVASIRPSHNPFGLRISGNRFDCNMPLKDLIATAYEIKSFQIAGPDWLDSERFEVQATIPAGSPHSQVPKMLRKLLEDRFKLKAHSEKKNQSVYLLVVPKKDDLKLGKADETVDTADAKPLSATSPISSKRDGNSTVQIDSRNGMVSRGRAEQRGSTVIMRMEILRASMPALADYLTGLVDRPVVDATSLKDSYRLMLDLPMDVYQNAILSKPVPFNNSRGAFGDAAGATPPTSSSGNEVTVNAALAKIGLKLESRKSPIDTLTIERIEKTPTEN